MTKFKVGDRVTIKDSLGDSNKHSSGLHLCMEHYSGKTAIITEVNDVGSADEQITYALDIDDGAWYWNSTMFKGNETHDFIWAVKQMKEGKKVRRSSWGNKDYYYMVDDRKYICPFSNTLNMSGLIIEIDGDDWEIFEDKKALYDLKETTQDTGSDYVFREKDLKNAINKLKECNQYDFEDTEWKQKLTEIFGEELL